MSRGLVTGDFPRKDATERLLVAASTMTAMDSTTTSRSAQESIIPITE
jgi:hypothetical protein